MTEQKPMAVLQDGLNTMPCALDRLIELYQGEETDESRTEFAALLEASKNLAYNLKKIMDVIM